MKFTKDTQGWQFSKAFKKKKGEKRHATIWNREMKPRVQVLYRLEGKVKYIEQIMNDISSTILFWNFYKVKSDHAVSQKKFKAKIEETKNKRADKDPWNYKM